MSESSALWAAFNKTWFKECSKNSLNFGVFLQHLSNSLLIMMLESIIPKKTIIDLSCSKDIGNFFKHILFSHQPVHVREVESFITSYQICFFNEFQNSCFITWSEDVSECFKWNLLNLFHNVENTLISLCNNFVSNSNVTWELLKYTRSREIEIEIKCLSGVWIESLVLTLLIIGSL